MKESTSVYKLGIFIPSLGRAGAVRTLTELPKSIHDQVHLVVHKSEYRKYKEIYGDVVLRTSTNGIGNVRQWIMESSAYDYVLMLDDDMSFSHRQGTKLKPAGPKQVMNMICQLYDWLEVGFVHVGISPRFGNFQVDTPFADVTRMNNAYAYRVKPFLSQGIRFNRLQVMEDFDVTLTLLEKGYPNRVSYEYAWAQRKSGDDGGCSLYRTSRTQAEAAQGLKKLHPKYVKVVKKTSKVAWKGFESRTRTDVNIQWKKAYHPKRDKQSGISKFL